MTDSSIQALIVEDHSLVRQGVLRLLLDEWPRCAILECSNFQEASRLISQRDWDFVLLDYRLPDGRGLDLVAKAYRPQRVLMISVESGQELMHAARDAGCGGFVAKSEAPSQFLSAVHAVLDGKLHFPKLDPEARPIPLSRRENQVYLALVQGKPVQDLAQELGVTYASVQTYKKRIFGKLNVTNMVDFLKKSTHIP